MTNVFRKSENTIAKKTLLAMVCALSSHSVLSDGMSQYDADGDGALSRDEFHGTVRESRVPSAWDNNEDGRLDASEWEGTESEDDFLSWDKDFDGHVDSDEYHNHRFDDYDQDQDGYWNDDEWDDAADDAFWDV